MSNKVNKLIKLLTITTTVFMFIGGCQSISKTDDKGTLVEPEPPEKSHREQQIEKFAEFSIEDVWMTITGVQTIDEYKITDRATQQFKENFIDKGIWVKNSNGNKLDNHFPEKIREFCNKFNCDLVLVISGEINECNSRPSLGILYEAVLRANIYDANGDYVVSVEKSKKGSERTQYRKDAANMALDAASDELYTELTDNLINKVLKNIVVQSLTLDGLTSSDDIHAIRNHLTSQEGVNKVDIIRWDAKSGIPAEMIVYLTPEAKDRLHEYIKNSPISINITQITK